MAEYRSYYEVLGLDAPPADRKAVKRAYSKMLKVTRPEDDPEGFMRLRDAHDAALNIVAREAENAAWKAKQQNTPDDTSAATLQNPNLTYEDMLPEQEPESETSYAIRATPNFDAPVTQAEETDPVSESHYAVGPSANLHAPATTHKPKIREEPKAPPLLDMIEALLDTPENYNDREKWNQLFRNARRLDIDDYVDFEHLLLEKILIFHDYYDNDNSPHYDTPEKLPQKLSPSISASLFKTMSWDKVNTQGHQRGYKVAWLQRRMMARIHKPSAVPIPETDSSHSGKVWMVVLGLFFTAKLIEFLVNS